MSNIFNFYFFFSLTHSYIKYKLDFDSFQNIHFVIKTYNLFLCGLSKREEVKHLSTRIMCLFNAIYNRKEQHIHHNTRIRKRSYDLCLVGKNSAIGNNK